MLTQGMKRPWMRQFTLVLFALFSVLNLQAQVTANFSGTPLAGCSPLVVQFTDLSTGPVTTWFWNFGNGNTSTLQNPAAVYVTPGTYTVTLTVSDGVGNNTLTQNAYITVFEGPTANFTNATPRSGCAPLTVCFSDLSTPGDGAINGWLWDFGDGNTSTAQNPCHTYGAPGNYTVSLVATDVNGCNNSLVMTNYVSVSTVPNSAFTGSPLSACDPPLTVNFTNSSTGGAPPLSFQWNFGDGNTSTLPNPSNTYTTTGSYTVTLITTDANGCADTAVINSYVNINNLTANFTPNDPVICEGQSVSFTNTSSPGATNWAWNFGDGGTSTAQNPNHTYTTAGTYTVTLIASNASCADTVVQTNVITVNPAPVAGFVADTTTSCEVPFTVGFTDQSTGNPSSWLWNFGDGNTSTAQNPSHTYTAPGNYTVTLTVTGPNGCTDTHVINNYIQIEPPVANFVGTPLQGCVPLNVAFTDQSVSNEPIVSWQWDFGDGGTSTAQNPGHVYTATGVYTVTLIITNSAGCTDTLVRPNYVTVGDVPIACFSNTPDSACVNDPISFTDCSTNATTWFWTFGDGGTSTAQNPNYAYQDTGCFNVTLVVTNLGCMDDTVINSAVCISPPLARFNLTPAVGCDVPHLVTFTDNSILPDTWLWDFGDGGTSTVPNPTHTYVTPGSYTVTLTVSDTVSGCTDDAQAQVNVSIVTAGFTSNLTTGCGPLAVNFTNTSTSTVAITNSFWTFGEGGTSTAMNPTHTYQNPGTYTVTLVVTDANGCQDTIAQPSLITVIGPNVNFVADTLAGCDSLFVSFTDQTVPTAPITSWAWNFGDGNTSTLQNPTHMYYASGNYTVTLTVTDADGCVRSRTRNQYISVTSPTAAFVVDDSLTCMGVSINFDNNSTGSGLSYLWDFGDGSTSTATNPNHAYTVNGTYTVTLTVTDVNGCVDSAVQAGVVSIQDALADFGAVPTNASCPPLLVAFSDSSVYDIVGWQWDFGDGTGSTLQNPSHVYTIPGSYDITLSVVNDDGCRDTLFSPGLINILGPYGDFSFSPDSGCTPQMVNFGANATNTATYTWDFGDGNVAITLIDTVDHVYTQTGVFYPILILDDGNGCTYSILSPDSIVIDTIPFVDFAVNSNVICGMDSVYFTDLTVSTRPITSWYWDFGDGNTSTLQNPVHYYNAPGNYTVTLGVVNSLGCTDTISLPANVSIYLPPTAAFVPSDTIGCDPFIVSFADASTGPQSIVGWNWDFGDGNTSTLQNPTNTFVGAGTYLVTLIVTDSGGCQDTVDRPIVVNPGPTASFVANDTVGCPPHPVTFVASGGMGIVGFEWNFGDGNTGTGNPVSHTYMTSGNFTVTLVVTDTLGCTDTLVRPQYIDIHPPVADFTQDVTSGCPPLSVTFTDNSTFTNTIVDWDWDFGDGNTGTGTPVTHSYATPGVYTVTLVVTDSVGCMDTIVKPNLINVYTPPTANFGIVDTVACVPFTIELRDSSVGGSAPIVAWFWAFGDGGSSTAQNPTYGYTIPGAYDILLIVTNANGCQDTSIFPFVAPPPPVANFAAIDTTGCPPFATTFTADTTGGIVFFQWDFGDGSPAAFGNPVSHTYTTSGNFTVTLIVEDGNGCRDTLVRPQYIDINPPVADFTQNVTSGCPPLSVTFTDNSTFTNTVVAWDWDFGDGNTGTGTPVTHTYLTPGIYTVTLVITDDVGCRDTIVKPNLIEVFTPPTALFGITDTLACLPFTIQLTDSSTGNSAAVVAWFWDFGDGATSTLQSPSHPYPIPGPYTITLIVTDANGCRDTFGLPFVAPPPPVANFIVSDSVGCPPFATVFTADTTGGLAFFQWDFGDGSPAAFGNPVSHTYLTSGNFTVTLIVEDGNGCRDTLTRPNYIRINPPVADFNQSNVSGCPPLSVTFTDNSTFTNSIVAWDWDFGDGNTGTGTPVTHTYAAPGVYTVTLIITDSVGCQDTIEKPNLITVFTPPTALFGITDTLACDPFTIQLTDSSTGTVGITAWAWDFGDGGTSTVQNPVHGYANVGPYTITLVVTDANGCQDTFALPFDVPVRPNAYFEASDSLGCAPFPVDFLADSTDVVSYFWDFGDGVTSNVGPSTSHTYLLTGHYTVMLVIEDIYGCFDTLVRPNYIFVDSLDAAFTQSVSVGCPPAVVTFTDQTFSDTTVVAWVWDFGDGGTSTLQNPVHTYSTPGTYTVTLTVTNAIGCMDTAMGPVITIFDPVPPAVPPILMVTVESDLNDSLSWLAYRGPDFSHYVVYRENPTGSNNWLAIDSIYNALDTTYRDVPVVTLVSSYCYKLQVVDVCGLRSSLDSSSKHCTINLEASPGIDEAYLNWNSYVGWDSILQYDIFRVSDYDTNNVVYLGTVPGTDTTFTDTTVVCYEDYFYRVHAFEAGGFGETSWSDTSGAAPVHVPNSIPMHICAATVVSDSFVEVQWDFPLVERPMMLFLEKSENGQTWTPIATLSPYDLTYTDLDVLVNDQSYWYRIAVLDSCGDISPWSNVGRTMVLEAENVNQAPELFWNEYEEWAGGISEYEVEVFNELTQAWQLVTAVANSSTSFIDFLTMLDQPFYCYRIWANENGGSCRSLSNTDCVPVGPRLFAPNAFTPNGDGLNDLFELKGLYIAEYHFMLFDRWGALIYESFSLSDHWDGTWRNKPCQEGVYVWVVKARGFDMTEIEKRGSCTLIR